MNIIKNIADIKTDALRNKNVGTFAWLVNRFTGLMLVFYLCLHLCVLGSNLLFGDGSFDLLMGNFTRPLFKLMEVGLIAAIAFHGINGLRIIIADFFGLTKYQKELFWGTMVIVITIVSITFKVFFF